MGNFWRGLIYLVAWREEPVTFFYGGRSVDRDTVRVDRFSGICSSRFSLKCKHLQVLHCMIVRQLDSFVRLFDCINVSFVEIILFIET